MHGKNWRLLEVVGMRMVVVLVIGNQRERKVLVQTLQMTVVGRTVNLEK
jgi:hypothetical protein